MLLLHGLASQRRFWNLVIPHLRGLPLLALDQRGHGESEIPSTGYDTATIARDVTTAMDAVGWSRCLVVGHSWGGTIALQVAAAHAERVLGVVCIDGGFSVLPTDTPRSELRSMLEPPRFAAPLDELRNMVRSSTPWWSPEVERAVLPGFVVGDDGLARARLPFEQHMQVVDAMLAADPAAAFDRITCPTWLVSAEPVSPEDGAARWMASKVSGLEQAALRLAQPRLFRWGGAVHDVPLQWPALVAGLVRAAADESNEGGRAGD